MRWIDGYRPWAHAEGGWNKNATATTAYTITSNAPSYQLLRPSETTAATTAVAKTNDASSKISKSSVMTFAVSRERSEEHTSELQSRFDLVCRLLLEKKKKTKKK